MSVTIPKKRNGRSPDLFYAGHVSCDAKTWAKLKELKDATGQSYVTIVAMLVAQATVGK